MRRPTTEPKQDAKYVLIERHMGDPVFRETHGAYKGKYLGMMEDRKPWTPIIFSVEEKIGDNWVKRLRFGKSEGSVVGGRGGDRRNNAGGDQASRREIQVCGGLRP